MNGPDAAAARRKNDLPEILDRRSQSSSISNAIVLVDKPSGCSSFDIVRLLRRLTGVRKVGHAGTLDPMASGLLICMVGRATKQHSSLVEFDKEYVGTVRLGETTPSFDAETPVSSRTSISHITLDDVRLAAQDFTGTIVQTTPSYSAVKVGGERLYKKARRGETTTNPPRVVTVHEFRVDTLTNGEASIHVRCSKGTYIRALADDLGRALGVGGHLIQLRRLSIGPYHVNQALTPESLAGAIEANPSRSATGA